MIEIKRGVESSVRIDEKSRLVSFGAFTIRFTDDEFHAFQWLQKYLSIKPADLLEDMIDLGMDQMLENYYDPEECE